MVRTGLPEAELWLSAHLTGSGDVVHLCSPDGAHEHFVTCGADCSVQLRDAATLSPLDGDTGVVGHHDSGVNALAAARATGRLATGCEDGQVRLFSYPEGALLALAARFTLPVRALAFTADGATLAAGGDDDVVRLYDTSGDGEACPLRHTLTGTFRAVRSLAFDPKVRALAALAAWISQRERAAGACARARVQQAREQRRERLAGKRGVCQRVFARAAPHTARRAPPAAPPRLRASRLKPHSPLTPRACFPCFSARVIRASSSRRATRTARCSCGMLPAARWCATWARLRPTLRATRSGTRTTAWRGRRTGRASRAPGATTTSSSFRATTTGQRRRV
jgi:hypothetical protein